MKTTGIILLLGSLISLPGYSQLNSSHNHIRPGDVLVKQQVEYADPTAKIASIEDYITCELYPNPVVSTLNLKYELKQDAKVSFELYSIEGMPVKKIKAQSKTAGTYYESIDCSNLQPKSYVLRIMANELMVNQIMIKK